MEGHLSMCEITGDNIDVSQLDKNGANDRD